MASRRVLATRIVGERGANKKVACTRCGVMRNVHHGGASDNRTGLCKDCSGALTAEQREKWKK